MTTTTIIEVTCGTCGHTEDRVPGGECTSCAIPPHLAGVTCPRCATPASRVREEFTQATRYEPQQSLGVWGYCRNCDVSFRVAR